MKRLSAKIKLTLWNLVLMVLMATILMLTMLYLSDGIITTNSKNAVTKVVTDNADEIEYDDKKIDFDDVDLFKNGVYTVVFSQDGEHLLGSLPIEIESDFKDKEVIELVIDENTYYIYDTLAKVEDHNSYVWVRGVMLIDVVANTTKTILQIALFSLPLLIILGAIGSYFIAKKTFSPIDKIINTAQEIKENEDLSLRIGIDKGSEEIVALSNTFDAMFEKLENSFKAEKLFTSDVSHELRTPTAVILAQCEYALSDGISIDDKEEALETVQRQALKMSGLISNLLTLNRLDRGIEKANFKNINFSELTQNICKEYKLIAPSYIDFVFDITPNITATMDYTMITRLVSNLISNAIKYTKEAGLVKVGLYEEDDFIILSVSDNGIGISKENQEKIWQRFYQVDPSRTANENGSMGLGLSMVAQIAKIHKAKIEIESTLDEGSTFIVKFKK